LLGVEKTEAPKVSKAAPFPGKNKDLEADEAEVFIFSFSGEGELYSRRIGSPKS
jgi:hypothetical protein